MARYEKGDKKYISVTQLIDIFFPFNEKSFSSWCKKNGYDPEKINRDSTRMGTKVSEWIENAVLGIQWIDSPCTNLKEEGLYRAVQDFLGHNKIETCEQTVYCDEFGFAGTYDIEGYLPRRKTLADSKTYGAWRGKYTRNPEKIKKVQIQDSMYAYAKYGKKVEEQPEVLDFAVVVFKTDGTWEIERFSYTDEWKALIKEHQEEINLLLNTNDTNTIK